MNLAPEWAKRALDRGLTPGRKMRLDCACGAGKTLLVTHNGDAIRGYCFRGKGALWWGLQLSFQERLAVRKATADADIAAASAVSLPGDVSERLYHPHDWPAAARVWLYDAGLNDDDIREWGIYYHVGMERVVLSLNGGLAWIARSVHPERGPRYLFPSAWPRGEGAWLTGRDAVVVTEDILSAYRINRATGYAACCLLGTSTSKSIALKLKTVAGTGYQIVSWLDGDRFGKLGAASLCQMLGHYDVPVVNVCTPRDPKTYDKFAIGYLIDDALNKEAS